MKYFKIVATTLLLASMCVGSAAFAQSIAVPAPGTGTMNSVGPVQGTTSATGIDIVAGTPGFSTFAQIISAVGITDTLRGNGPYTIFAPTDEAFARMPQGELRELLRPENRERLRAIAQYWVVPQSLEVTGMVRGPQSVQTMQGANVVLKKAASGAYTVNGANIIERDVAASNGQIQVIDSVLLPDRRTPADDAKNATQ